MKHIKLFEEFITEARLTPAQSWLTDHHVASIKVAEAEHVIELIGQNISMMQAIKDPINADHMRQFIEHQQWNQKRHTGFMKKAMKTVAGLMKELPEVTTPSLVAALPACERAAELKGKYEGMPFIQDNAMEFAKERYTTNTKDLKTIGAHSDAYQKEHAAGVKELEAANKEYLALFDQVA